MAGQDVLDAAGILFGDGSDWMKGGTAQLANGKKVGPLHPDATKFDLYGAMYRASQTSTPGNFTDLAEALDMMTALVPPGESRDLDRWNDAFADFAAFSAATGLGGGAPVLQGFVGNQNTDGSGNWGFSADRGMGNTFTLAHEATLKTGYLYIIPSSGSGSTPIKQCVYTDNAGAAGTLLAVSAPTIVSADGWAQFTWADEIIMPQDIHIVCVAGTVTGAGWDMGSFNSGGLPAARIYNGTISYASPTTPAPAPTTQYNNGLSTYIEYEYS